MKYQTNTKWQRNKEIVEYRKDHPELTIREIGKVFGISGSRVFQIIDRAQNGKAWQRL
jgi:DNA-directed RNA polymerase specialized sigma subunit